MAASTAPASRSCTGWPLSGKDIVAALEVIVSLIQTTISLSRAAVHAGAPSCSGKLPRWIKACGKGQPLIRPAGNAADHQLYLTAQASQLQSCLVRTVAMRPSAVDDE